LHVVFCHWHSHSHNAYQQCLPSSTVQSYRLNIPKALWMWLLPYPCSHFYFDIKFGNRLYSKEKRRAWPMTMTGKIRYMPLLKSKQVSSRWWYLPLSLNLMRLWYINTFFCVGFHRVRGIQLDQIWVRP
jgi:hypothetical protein